MRKLLYLLIGLFSVCLVSCRFGSLYKEESSGLFRYMVDDNDEAIFVGLTDSGEKESTIVIPSYIEGHRLTTIGYPVYDPPGFTNYHIDMKSDVLQRIYFTNSITTIHDMEEGFFNDVDRLRCIYWPGDISFYGLYPNKDVVVYVTNDNLKNYTNVHNVTVMPANVVYYLNYDSNSVYFIDDCNDEVIKTIPPVPIREGYTFKGWFKDSGSTQEWNFEKDKVPQKRYDADSKYQFIETALYAGWE